MRLVALTLAVLLLGACARDPETACERDGYGKGSPEFSDCVARKTAGYAALRVPIRTTKGR